MLKNIYHYYLKIIQRDGLFERTSNHATFLGDSATSLIKKKIEAEGPLMISRFGANELNYWLNYHYISQGLVQNVLNLPLGLPFFLKMKPSTVKNMAVGAGFFPASDKKMAERFYELIFEDMKEIDVLASWMNQEQFIFNYLKREHSRIRLRDLSPLSNIERPWTKALEGKNILVIHPFEATIVSQFRKRNLLFENPDILPDFNLKVIKAVQTIAGNHDRSGFRDWFDALDFMKEAIDRTVFDIAIIGCGAYGMPLAAHVKRIGKKAVHIGGETQLLFGIKGKRWEGNGYNYSDKFYNEHWTKPLPVDTPLNSNTVEGGCYW